MTPQGMKCAMSLSFTGMKMQCLEVLNDMIKETDFRLDKLLEQLDQETLLNSDVTKSLRHSPNPRCSGSSWDCIHSVITTSNFVHGLAHMQ
eukprot:6126848-Amphidinium_carterae.1